MMKSTDAVRIVVTDNCRTEPPLMTTKKPRARRMATVLTRRFIAERVACMRRLARPRPARIAEAGMPTTAHGQ